MHEEVYSKGEMWFRGVYVGRLEGDWKTIIKAFTEDDDSLTTYGLLI